VYLKGIATNEDYAMLLRAAKAVGSLSAARKAWEDMLGAQVGGNPIHIHTYIYIYIHIYIYIYIYT